MDDIQEAEARGYQRGLEAAAGACNIVYEMYKVDQEKRWFKQRPRCGFDEGVCTAAISLRNAISFVGVIKGVRKT